MITTHPTITNDKSTTKRKICNNNNDSRNSIEYTMMMVVTGTTNHLSTTSLPQPPPQQQQQLVDIPSMTTTTARMAPEQKPFEDDNYNNTTTTTNDCRSGEETATIRINDVLCGRGKVDHAGNAYFRQVVAEQLNDFKFHQSQKNRHGMAQVVQRIVQKVHATGGRFMDQNWRGMWVEISEKERRQKVDRACRDAKKNSVVSTKSSITMKPPSSTPVASTSSSSGVVATTTAAVETKSINTMDRNSDCRRADGTTTGIQYNVIPNRTLVTPTTNNTVALPPSTMARLYPLTSGLGLANHDTTTGSYNVTTNSTTTGVHKNKRKSSEQRVNDMSTSSFSGRTIAVADTNDDRTNERESSAEMVVMDVPSSSSLARPITNLVGDHVGNTLYDITVTEQQRYESQHHTMAISDFYHIENPTYQNVDPLPGNPIDSNKSNNILESSISSLDKLTQTAALTLSSLPHTTAPTLEFSCGSLAFDNSFVLPENHPNPRNGSDNEASLASFSRPLSRPKQSTSLGPDGNTMQVLPKTSQNNNNNNNNNASLTLMMTSISTIPNDFLNRSGISDMEFSAVSLDLFTPGEEEGGTKHNVDTEESEATNVLVRNNSTTSTATTAMSAETIDPTTLVQGTNRHEPQHNRSGENYNNNESAAMMDASVSVLDLNQSYSPGSFFDASFNNINNDSLMMESSSTTALTLTNPIEKKDAVSRPVVSKNNIPQQRDQFLDRYDLLKREESVDTIIAGNLRRHSQISKGGGGPKSADDDENDLSASFNMSLDICALPSANEDDDEEETPKPERSVKNIFTVQQQHPRPQPLLSETYLRSPEKKKVKDNTLSPSKLTRTSIKSNVLSGLLSSNEELNVHLDNDNASVSSSLFSAGS